MSDAMGAETVRIRGAGGDEIEAYLAQPLDESRRAGGMVVIHHMPGYDEATKEITRRFAVQGYPAICPNLYWRIAPGASPDDAAAAARAQGGISDEQLIGDVAGAAEHLGRLPVSNGKVGTIGYCSGGRQSVLAACSLTLAAAIDCYGAFVMRNPPDDRPVKMRSIADQLGDLSCPLLGLFGEDDQFPSPEEVDELEAALTKHGKTFEFHSYPGAGHAFFNVDRPAYRPEAAADGWQRIWTFLDEHLGS